MDDAYIVAALKLVDGFGPWTNDMIELRDAMSTRPMGFSSKELLSGIEASRLERETARYTEMVSGKLVNMVMNYTGRMINGRLIIAPADVSDDPPEQALRENLAACADGFISELDHNAQSDQKGTSWRWIVANQSAFPGKCCGLFWIRKDKNGKAHVTVEMWDPLQVAHDFDTSPKRIVHFFATSRGAAREWLRQQWVKGQPAFTMVEDGKGTDADEETVTIHDVWVREAVNPNDPDEYEVRRGILVNSTCVGIQLIPDQVYPIVRVSHATTSSYSMGFGSGGAASSGTILSPGQTGMRGRTYEAIRDHCQPFFASLKVVQQQWKVALSEIYAGLAKSLDPTMLYLTPEGQELSPPGTLSGPGGEIAGKIGELQVQAVNRAVQAMEGAARLVVEQFEKQFGEVYNLVLMGQSPANDSGYKDNQKISHAIAVLNEPAACAASFVDGGVMELVRQLQADPSLVIVAQPRSKTRGGFSQMQRSKVRNFSAKNLPDDPRLDVTWSPDLGDWMAKLAAAQQEAALGLPMQDIWSRQLDIVNVQYLWEMAQKEDMDQKTQNDPRVIALNITQTYLEKWLEAQQAAASETDPRQKQALQAAADFYQKQYAYLDQQTKAGPQPGQGTPAAPPGIAPQFGGTSMPTTPDQRAQARGTVSSATGGPGSVGVLGGGGGGPVPMMQTTIRSGKPINKTVMSPVPVAVP